MDLGITGGDQVAEHDALLAKNRRELEGSRQGTPKSKGIGLRDLTDAQLQQQRLVPNDSYSAPSPHRDPSHDTPTPSSSLDLDSVTLDHEDDDHPDTNEGVEQVMDLGFGHCKLQAQAPERGSIDHPAQLIGKNVVTSFVGVTEQYFRDLEEAHAADDDPDSLFEEREATPEFMARIQRRKLRTRIKYVGGSVEAACALGVADGIVDLVGMFGTFSLSLSLSLSLSHPSTPLFSQSPPSLPSPFSSYRARPPPLHQHCQSNHPLTSPPNRIRRNHESSRSESHRHRPLLHRRAHQIPRSLQPCPGGSDRQPDPRGDHGAKVYTVPIQHPPQLARSGHEDHPREKGADDHGAGGSRVGGGELDGGEESGGGGDG